MVFITHKLGTKNNMPLYHCSHLNLVAGDIVEPGNWGKEILKTGLAHPAWYREIILEAFRLQYFPTKPSRLHSTFTCESVDTIMCYKLKNTPAGYLYAVELVDEMAATHKGDFNAVEPLPRLQDNMMQIAFKYWRYDLKTSVDEWPGIECSEIVAASALRIQKIIE